MVKRLLLIALIALVVLVACELPAPTPTGEPGATDTPTATLEVATLTPSPSATITLTPTDTATVIPTSTPVLVYTERLENGDFEMGFDNSFPQIGVFYGVADNWFPVVWRGFPIPRLCEDGQTESCNPSWMTDRVPEYKPANNPNVGDPFRTLSGNAQQFFCAEQHCFAGIAQTIQTTAGESCVISAWGQTWGAADGRSCGTSSLYRSDDCTEDDRDNMHLLVIVNPAGDGIQFPFPDSYYVMDFGYADGIYDEPDGGAVIGYPFEATGPETTVAFIGYQLWPAIANWYVDAASVSCNGVVPAPAVDLEATPTPIATPVAEASVFVVEAQGLESEVKLEPKVYGEYKMDFSEVAIAGLVAAFISLVLEVVPGVADLWNKVDKKYKSLIVLVVSLVVPPAIVGLSCVGVDVGFGQVCPDPSNPQLWVDAVLLGLAAFFASQVTFEYASASLGERVKKA